MPVFRVAVVLAALGTSLSEEICTTGLTFSGFKANTELDGDYIGDGSTSKLSATWMRKDGSRYPHDLWLDYDSPERTAANVTQWSIYTRGTGGEGKLLLAWCSPGVAGCPTGIPSTNDNGRIWPKSAGAMQWNVTLDGKISIEPDVRTECCAWQHDKCDDCKCADALLKPFCQIGCGKECCRWACNPVAGFPCNCFNGGIARRHCQHGNAVKTTSQSQAELLV